MAARNAIALLRGRGGIEAHYGFNEACCASILWSVMSGGMTQRMTDIRQYNTSKSNNNNSEYVVSSAQSVCTTNLLIASPLAS